VRKKLFYALHIFKLLSQIKGNLINNCDVFNVDYFSWVRPLPLLVGTNVTEELSTPILRLENEGRYHRTRSQHKLYNDECVMNRKWCGMKGLWLKLKQCPEISLKGLRKTNKAQNSQSPSRRNPGPPE